MYIRTRVFCIYFGVDMYFFVLLKTTMCFLNCTTLMIPVLLHGRKVIHGDPYRGRIVFLSEDLKG